MLNKNFIKHITILSLALAASAFAQKAGERIADSLDVPKNFENYNEFQVDKWGPITYSGSGKCDVLDLYQRNVAQGFGYSTIVDYHYKQTKFRGEYSCEAWGLGLSFKVIPDSSKNSETLGLPANSLGAFSARGADAIKKFFNSDSAFLEVASITPVTFQAAGECNEVDFLFKMANETSGFHGIIDIKYDEAQFDNENVCTYWGLGVKYKRRDVVEKVTTKKRIIEVVKVPPPKPDTVFVPTAAPAKPAKNCCISCCCD